MREQRVSPDHVVARVAGRQHGVITFEQLLRAGLSTSAISRAAASGRLHRLYRGVYAVGHRGLANAGRWMAAVLACGHGAALSHRPAAELWNLLDSADGPAHVTVPVSGGRARRPGIHLHRAPSRTNAATTIRNGIRVTTPQRTLEDLRRTLPPGDLRRAIRNAEIAGLPIDATALIDDRATSELELRFLALCRRHRLGRPAVNVRVGPFRVDFLWPSARLIVETDGERYQRGMLAASADAARDRQLRALGFEVIRFTYRDVVDRPREVAAAIRTRLNRTL